MVERFRGSCSEHLGLRGGGLNGSCCWNLGWGREEQSEGFWVDDGEDNVVMETGVSMIGAVQYGLQLTLSIF